uniref:Neur_chan_LBD domain-containing protein n=1 Tax=Steinernema glaseri TaxID=37863 RepID=A0A1I7YEN7_9BILA
MQKTLIGVLNMIKKENPKEKKYWQDEFLQWNPADFDGLEEMHVPADMVWKPDLLVYN